ncbi:hypothetical protein [Nocardioides sp. TF02-7]|uniref:hypothetical protein n=1 Tax=Nocardioides sp. TF02-7 TaxID=2917724 RepID=UPI001F066A38|nr:hypothetical protein [Nocardioides sp. TF02-7]UMG93391.1 hypothetical protein MF408_03830 [Nocardioides sp. TF02-7]
MNTHHPDNRAWEAAMSRDFDARVRDLHEAPLDLTVVKGRARRIRRNRRAAVAGGVLGVAAVVTPIGVLAGGGDTDSRQPDFAPEPTEQVSGPDYVIDRVWHQADGDVVALPDRDYTNMVLWDDQLVATAYSGEVFSTADVISGEGEVVDSFETTWSPVVDEAGATLAWVGVDGSVTVAWDGGEAVLGTVDLGAAGEGIAWEATAVTGGPDCDAADSACTVYVDNNSGGRPLAFRADGTSDNPVPGALSYKDATEDGRVTVMDEITDFETCSGVYDLAAGDHVWRGCEFQAWQVSPDGDHVAGLPSYFDGLGPTSISVLDAATGEETGRWAADGAFVADWAWTADGRLAFTAYDGARWHLYAMAPDGEVEELAPALSGNEMDSPFRLIHR